MADTTPTPWRERWESGDVTLLLGDCLEVMPTLGKVDAVVTSPPYAMQRTGCYQSIDERRYHFWTAQWCSAVPLGETASILINIRENVKNGELSDYVHQTRLELRRCGFIEHDELIWIKPGAPPVGHAEWPRRSWERILWFSGGRHPACFPKANGQESDRIGFPKSQVGIGGAEWITGYSEGLLSGVSRCRDYVEINLGEHTQTGHPAAFPVPLAEWLINLFSSPPGLILDPFMGSGTTGVACVRLGRRFVGIEIKEKYYNIAKRRIAEAQADVRDTLPGFRAQEIQQDMIPTERRDP